MSPQPRLEPSPARPAIPRASVSTAADEFRVLWAGAVCGYSVACPQQPCSELSRTGPFAEEVTGTKATQRTEPGSHPPASAPEPPVLYPMFFRRLFLVSDTSESHSPGLPPCPLMRDLGESDSR
ncbi:hypothetical protein HJG60_008053 [Phyllostomus discolor]|uniref:Uncharacterized protein n=1 Tax=Phyllostomus discolor TaxID=89673 RepID=A0A834BK35_9CHIR|nr:hypothetical protein HJG60_008053 [Phyllostomus discolor]